MTTQAFGVWTCLFCGAVLPWLLGTITVKQNHKCGGYRAGCFDDYACSVDAGHCAGTSGSKKGTGIPYGTCISLAGFTCNENDQQPCYVETYYSDSQCTEICGSASNTTTGCEAP